MGEIQKTNASPEQLRQLRAAYINRCLESLQKALGWKLSEDRIKLYVAHLLDIGEARLRYGFAIAIKSFKRQYGKDFPDIAEIREWSMLYVPELDGNRFIDEYKQNGGKPANWEPIPKEELSKLTEKIKEAARSKAMPDVREISESMVADKNGASGVPLDPGERRAWARNKAVENGWAEREPGCE